MRVEIHDKGSRVEVKDLTALGARDMIFQCEQLIEQLLEQEASEESEDARPEHYRVHHDILGWYVVQPNEDEPEDGFSLGFDGRAHYETESGAWEAAREAADAPEVAAIYFEGE